MQAQFTYTTNNGTLTITGYTGPGGAVTIPSTINGLAVTRIGDYAFQFVTRIVAIEIPSGVVRIGSRAFNGCSALTSVTITNGLAAIGGWAFQECTALTNITIPTSVTNFEDAVFQSCTNLESVNIPNRISKLPNWTFVYCSSLKSITIPTNITSIEDQAFRGCSSLTSITIPNSVTNIGGSAFSSCTSLTNLLIPGSVISIGAQAFYGTSLTSVWIPASVIGIGMQAFVNSGLTAIEVDPLNPSYGSAAGVLFDKSGATLLQYPRGKAGSAYAIPDSVTVIGPWAFDGCLGLTYVIIPASVISIEGYGFSGCANLTAAYFLGSTPNIYFGSSTFNGANKVIVYYMPGTFGWGPTFSGRPTMLGNPVQAQFNYVTNNGTITITGYTGPGGAVTILSTINGLAVTSIGSWAFVFNSSITDVAIPNSVTNIGDGAFYWCTSLTNVTIPHSVTNIGIEVFEVCTSLASINVDVLNPVYSSVDGVLFNKGQTTLIKCPGGKAGSYTIPNGVSEIEYQAFDCCTNLTSVTVPDSVTSIGSYPFNYCTALTTITVEALNPVYSSVDGVLLNKSQTTLIRCPGGKAGNYTVPNGVTEFAWFAFNHCTSLNSATIPESVINIGQGSFDYCASLTAINVDVLNPVYSSVDGVLFNKGQTTLIKCPGGKAGNYTIPDGVSEIRHEAFYYCISLTSVMIPNSVTEIGFDAFSGCTSLSRVTIGDSVSLIGNYAFYNCTNLTSVTIPSAVTRVAAGAFYACTGLVGIYFQGNAPSLGPDAFTGDGNPTIFFLPGKTGWGATFGGRPTALWQPQMLTPDGSFGVRTNQFGFNIAWAEGMPVVVDACTDLANPIWSPLQTNTLTSDTLYFSDSQWTNYPARFYRVRWP